MVYWCGLTHSTLNFKQQVLCDVADLDLVFVLVDNTGGDSRAGKTVYVIKVDGSTVLPSRCSPAMAMIDAFQFHCVNAA